MRVLFLVIFFISYATACYGMMQLPVASKEQLKERNERVVQQMNAQWNRLFATHYSYRAFAGCLKSFFCFDTGDGNN